MGKGRIAQAARVALGSIRLVNGTAGLVAPDAVARRFGVDPGANPAAIYVVRLFGIRTALLGWDLLRSDPETRARALRVAPLIHATDTVSAALAGASGRLPRRAAVTAAAISATNTALALVARPR